MDLNETPQLPHPPLTAYYPGEAQRHEWVLDLFDRTAVDYERIERLMALGSGSRYRRRALAEAGLGPGMSVIDVGVGTGLVAREAARLNGAPERILGVDPSRGMVENARVPPGVRLEIGSAESVPAPDASTDFLSMGYALRHISDLSVVFREFYRVLRPGGRLCLLEITPPAPGAYRSALRFYMRALVPLLARWVAHDRETPQLMRYYWDTIEACAPAEVILSAIGSAGFVQVHRQVDLGIFSAYRARKPAV